jgi:hypothetical protein
MEDYASMSVELVKRIISVIDERRAELSSAYDTCGLDAVAGIRYARKELDHLKIPIAEAIRKYMNDPFEED